VFKEQANSLVYTSLIMTLVGNKTTLHCSDAGIALEPSL
jgi:hypothetical protein